MKTKNKEKTSLAQSMMGAKKSFDDRLKNVENLTLATPKKTTRTNVIKKKVVSTNAKNTKNEPTKLDSFTFPKSEHEGIQCLILEFAKQGMILNKSEIVRLGLQALKKMNKSEKENIHKTLHRVKVGRPPKNL
jgi:hypothetical protein